MDDLDGFDPRRLAILDDVLRRHVDDGHASAAAWAVATADGEHVGVAGTTARNGGAPVDRSTIFRIASMTKPMVSALALLLVEECRLRLEDPVDDLLPELAGRRVLVDGRGPIDGPTVPAERPITVHDVLTFRLGWGMDLDAPWPQPLLDAMEAKGMGGGAPAPDGPPAPDEWMARLGELPLLHQPGERWLYNTGADVLGVLVARAGGAPLEVLLHDRLFEPLGLHDTAFWTSETDRLVTGYGGDGVAYDPPDGQWSRPPRFPSGAGGLVSTLDDVLAFGRMLLARRGGLLSPASVATMTTDQLLPGQGGPRPDGSQGWGMGVGVQRRRTDLGRAPGSYGWDGGLGTSWANDPGAGTVGVILTNQAFTSAFPPPAVIRDFWTASAAARIA
jgi:CubicO group peptidase (beta-lactamase class C family)